MYSTYFAKPWLEVTVGYVAGRLHPWPYDGDPDQRRVLGSWLANDGGRVTCHACPEVGEKLFRKRHTMAAFVRKHRNCGKPPAGVSRARA